jgi:hypothetical protein
LLVGALATGCPADPCTQLGEQVVACPNYVSATTSSGTTAPGTCNDAQQAEAQCLLDKLKQNDICALAWPGPSGVPSPVENTAKQCAPK